MIHLPAILVANGLGAALMLTLILSNRKNVRAVFFDEKLFFAMCLLTLLLCLCETASFCIDGLRFPGARPLALALNAFLFLADILFAFLWTVYMDYKLFGRLDRLRRIYPLMSIPALVICVLCVLNLFTDVFFTVSADNVYSRTSLVFLPYLVTYAYLIYGAALAFFYRKKVGKYLFLPVVVFLAPIFVGSLVQMHVYGISLIWVSVSFGLTSLYINLQNEVSLLDSLTKLYNRDYLTRYLNYAVQRIPSGRMLAGIMMDVNSFKAINDTYGHSEGDRALRAVSQILLAVMPGDDLAARFGGDEFILICTVSSADEVHALMANIRKKTEECNASQDHPYALTLSMGFTLYRPALDTLDTFLRRMDRRMYEQKRAHYSSGAHDRRRVRSESGPSLQPPPPREEPLPGGERDGSDAVCAREGQA